MYMNVCSRSIYVDEVRGLLTSSHKGRDITHQFTGRGVRVVPHCRALLVENTLATGVLGGTARTLDRDHDTVRNLVPYVGTT